MGIAETFASKPPKPSVPPREEFPFLVAEHAFDAHSLDNQSNRDPSAHCLSFTQKELAYVHSVHSSGWADVTLARNGERGWVPVDFFSVFRDVRAIPLLAAIAAFLQHPKSMRRPPIAGESHRIQSNEFTFSDAAINEIIAGMKLLLSKCGVVSRDSPTVARSPPIAAARKALLVDLAHIVHVAKHNMYSTDDKIIEKLVRACYRLLERTRVLLSELTSDERKQQLRTSASMISATSSRSERSSNRSTRNSAGSRNVQEKVANSTSNSSLQSIKSFTDHAVVPNAADRVYEVQGALSSYLLKFEQMELLNNPEDPQTSPAVLTLTRHCMLACRELLVVLDLPATNFDMIKDEILDEIRRLVTAARALVAALPPSPADQRRAAGHQLSIVAARCRKVTTSAAKTLLEYLQQEPQSLPDRVYPMFSVEPHDLNSQMEKMQLGDEPLSAVSEESSESPKSTNTLLQNNGGDLTPSRIRPRASHASSSPSISSTSSQAPQDLIFRNNQIRGGTLRALIDWLLGNITLEFELRTFLVCFRLFASPRDVVIELGSHTNIDAVKYAANLWVKSFYEPGDEIVLTSLEPYLENGLLTSRNELENTKQIEFLPLSTSSNIQAFRTISQTNFSTHFDKQGSQGSRSSSARFSTISPISMGNRSASTSSLPGNILRNPSFSTQFGTHSALNLAAQFREFGLSSRRTSRQASVAAFDENSDQVQTSTISEELLARAPVEIASQITLMWFSIFQKVQVSELLDQRFSSSRRKLGLAPNVSELVQNSNYLTAFVGDTILAGDLSVKQRTRVLKHWIRVAHEMYQLGNINGAVTIVSTLKTTNIERLSRVWDSLTSKPQLLLSKLTPLASPDRNFAECRKVVRLMADSNSFCIPYMGILLSDLVLIDEGNPKTLKPDGRHHSSEPIINFDRYLKMTKAIAQIQPFQKHELDIPADPSMQAWIRAQAARSHLRETKNFEDQWRRSLLIQPLVEK